MNASGYAADDRIDGPPALGIAALEATPMISLITCKTLGPEVPTLFFVQTLIWLSLPFPVQIQLCKLSWIRFDPAMA